MGLGEGMRPLNDQATDQIPIRLLMSLVIISAIVVLVVVVSGNLRTALAEQNVEAQCRAVEACLSTLAEGGAFRDVDACTSTNGDIRVITLTFPESLVYLCFGGDPDPLENGHYCSDLLEEGAVVCYKVEGGSKHMIWLPQETYRFREGIYVDNRWILSGDGQSLLFTCGGVRTLVFERVQKNHIKYILVHTTDEMNS